MKEVRKFWCAEHNSTHFSEQTFFDWECADGCCYEWNSTFEINGQKAEDYFISDFYYINSLDNILNALISKDCEQVNEYGEFVFLSVDGVIYNISQLAEISEFNEGYKAFDEPLKVLEFLGYRVVHEFIRKD